MVFEIVFVYWGNTLKIKDLIYKSALSSASLKLVIVTLNTQHIQTRRQILWNQWTVEACNIMKTKQMYVHSILIKYSWIL